MLEPTLVRRAFDEAGALHALLNLYGFVDDRTFLTKSGDLGVVFGVQGVDAECLDPDGRDAVARRFEQALRLLDERFRLYQYVIKRRGVVLPAGPAFTPDVTQLLRPREAELRERSRYLFTVSLYAVVIFESALGRRWARHAQHLLRHPLTSLREFASPARTLAMLDADLQAARDRLHHHVEAFAAQLADTLRPQLLDKAEAFRFFRRLLNYTPEKAEGPRLQHDAFLDYTACDSSIECHRDHLRVDDAFVQVLTLKDPPAHTRANLFEALLHLPCNVIVATEWRREASTRVRHDIQARRRHFHNVKASLVNYLHAAPPQPGDVLVDDSAAATVTELGQCLTELELHGRAFGHASLTIVLHDEERATVQQGVREALKVLSARDALAVDEHYNLLNAWLAIVPGNHTFNLRRLYLLDRTYADMAGLFSVHTGSPRNAHLRRECLATLETTHRTPYFLNLHCADVAHTVVLGATGSGKSFLLNFLLHQAQRYSPFVTTFDLGGGYASLAHAVGGRALKIGLEHADVRINPFALPPTREDLHFLFTFVKVLVQSHGQYTLTLEDDRDLYTQIENLYALDPDQRRLFTLANIVRRPLAQHLQRWVQGGPYAALFDNVTDTLTFQRFQAFDFEGMDRYPQLLEPLLFYVLHRANAVIHDAGEADALKLFVMDEAWRFLRDATVRAYIAEALKTWRKRNAALVLATQSTEDLDRSDTLRLVLESCPTRIFLANPGLDRTAARDLFELNDTETDRIATLLPRRQLLLKQPGVAKVLELFVDTDTARLLVPAPPHTPLTA